jgi:DNA modification methylase
MTQKRSTAQPLTHIKDLVPDPANRRKHNPRNIGMISDSLHAVGAARSIVIDEDNVILAGNGVTEAAAEAGITKLRVVDAAGDELIAVRRSGLTAEQKRALAIADNRSAELAEWSVDQLAADVEAGLDLKPWFSDEELEKLLGETGGKTGLTEPDDVPPERATDIANGDIFELGAHVLACGDCTTDAGREHLGSGIADLVLTDPLYGIGIVAVSGTLGGEGGPTPDGGQRGSSGGTKSFGTVGGKGLVAPRQYRPVYGDDRPFDPIHLLTLGKHQIIFGANYFASKLSDGKSWIAWDKNVHGNFSEVELAWTSHVGRLRLYRHTWSGLLREGPRNEELVDRVHPTQKPVGLFAQILGDFTEPNARVCDPYLGSGTTIIACERMGRRCLGMEIEAAYCQVIIDRWEAFTGQRASKCGEAVRA